MSYQPNAIKKTFHNSRRALSSLWLNHMPAIQIGITGSQGKTNTSATLYHLLSHLAPTIRTDLNLDTIYNVPITAFRILPWTKYAIFELGIDHRGEMDRHLEIVRPKIAVITGLSPVHTDEEHLGSFQNVIAEKRKLVEALPPDGYAVLNGDDENVRQMARHTKAKIMYYGTGDGNDIRATDIAVTVRGTSFSLQVGHTEPTHVTIPLIGRHHAYNVAASLAVYLILGYTRKETFRHFMTTLEPLTGRMSLHKGPLGTTVLDDSLRANPASTASGLNTLSDIKTTGRKIAILAEMGELEHPEAEHAKIGKMLASLDIDHVVTIGQLHRSTVSAAVESGFPDSRIIYVPHVLAAAEEVRKIIHPGDFLYMKGSLLRHIERVLMVLNGETVGCKAVVCPFYHHCPECKYKIVGFPDQ